MISGAVQQEYGRLLPRRRLLVQRADQALEEGVQHVAVGGGLRQGVPTVALGVDGRQQGEPGADGVQCCLTGFPLGRPHLADEGRPIQPALVDVDDPRAFFQQGQHLLCVLLPEDQHALGVPLLRDLVGFAVAQAELFFEHRLNPMLGRAEMVLLLHFLLDLPGSQHRDRFPYQRGSHVRDGGCLYVAALHLVLPLLDDVRLLSMLSDDGAHQSRRYSESSGHLRMGYELLDTCIDDVIFILIRKVTSLLEFIFRRVTFIHTI